MKIVVTGCKGQVGTELLRQGEAAEYVMVGMDADLLDITDPGAVEAAIVSHKPDAVINAAAYTAVDRAELDADAAFAVNRDGPANLAKVCADLDISLVHYSTDYVFDGSKKGAYVESDPVSPLGVYGQSKLAGEQAVRQKCVKHLIFRTSWVFSAHGHNFVKTMLRLGAEREELGVVGDQYGKPTAAAEIARVSLDVLAARQSRWGVYHLAQPEVINWHGFAEAVFAEACSQGVALKMANVKSIGTVDYPTPAKRPANSELDCRRLESTFGVTIRPWRESLAEVIKELRSV